MNRFMVRPAVYYAKGAMDCLRLTGAKRVLIIIDPVMKKNGAYQLVKDAFPQGTEFASYTNIRPDPSIELLGDGVQQALTYRPDFIVAVGGGSTIDAAKAIVYLYNRIGVSADVSFVKATFAIIPTTSGTGSEVTNVSVITVDEHKLVLVNDNFLPDMAVIDVEFTKTLPLTVLADTAVDALTHAIEAFLSRNHSDCTDALAEKAIQLIGQFLPGIFTHGDYIEARQRLHNASCIAGMAFTNASLGINHSIAHALGALFHIPHGRANAVLLPVTLAYNAQVDYVREKCVVICRLLGDTESIRKPQDQVQDAIRRIKELLRVCQMPTCIRELQIDRMEYEKAIPQLAKLALEDRCTPDNARSTSYEDFVELFQNAYNGGVGEWSFLTKSAKQVW